MDAEDQGDEHAAAELLANGFSQDTAPATNPSHSTIDASQHPILRLGWRPLCKVVCNGCEGEFLGGHDRDMFVQSSSLGGRVLTCSQFERESGRALSKKWKESLHVLQQKDGPPRVTLLAWLKQKAEDDFGNDVVGRRVWICWPGTATTPTEWRCGVVVAFNKDTGKHTVQYYSTMPGVAAGTFARFTEDLHLPAEQVSFEEPLSAMGGGRGATATVVSAAPCHAMIATGPSPMAGAAGASFNPIWHQNSGISVTSSLGDELNPSSLAFAMGSPTTGVSSPSTVVPRGIRSGRRRPRASVSGMTHVLADVAGMELASPPPKRTASAPASVLLREAVALASFVHNDIDANRAGTGGGGTTSGTRMDDVHAVVGEAAAAPRAPGASGDAAAGPGSVSPLTPHHRVSEEETPLGGCKSAPGWVPGVTVSLPAPPSAATSSQALATVGASEQEDSRRGPAAVSWMHDVALALDAELEEMSARLPSSLPPFSARFQALIAVLQTQSPGSINGLCEALVKRYRHYHFDAVLQRRKMAELVAAAVIQGGAVGASGDG